VATPTLPAIPSGGELPESRELSRAHIRRRASVFLILAAAGVIGAFFLGLYHEKGYTTPIGWDTSRYITATNLVAERGLRGVEDLAPPPTSVLSSRVGFSVMALSIATPLRLSLFEVAAVLPVLGAVALALAGGTFAATALRLRSWEAATAAAVIGLSPTLIRLVAPETYTDNLLAGAALVAALALVVSAAPLKGGTLAAALILLVAGGLIHTPSLAVVAGALVFTAAWMAPGSWRAWRGGQRLVETPSGSLALLLAGTGLLVGGFLLGVLGTAPDRFRVARETVAAKFRSDLGLYRFGLIVPLAAIGAAGFVAAREDRARDPRPRRSSSPGRANRDPTPGRVSLALLILVGWTLVGLVGVVLFLLGRASPAHRFLAFLIPLPLLVGVGIISVGRLVGRAAGRLGGAAIIVAGLAGAAFLGYHILYIQLPTERRVVWMDEGKTRDAANAAAYLDASGVSRSTPVVFVVDDTGPHPHDFVPLMANMIRSVLSAERIERAYVYVGDPAGYLAGKPTLRESPAGYNGTSLRFFRAMEPVLRRPHVALLMESFNPDFGEFVLGREDRIVAPKVVVLNGPLLERPLGDALRPSAPQGLLGLAGTGQAILGTVGLVGLGWGLTLLPRDLRLFEVVGLAPALGIATVVLIGVVVDSAAVRLSGFGGIVPLALAGGAGWAAAFLRLRREGPDLFVAD
jgi:hypothetical protein